MFSIRMMQCDCDGRIRFVYTLKYRWSLIAFLFISQPLSNPYLFPSVSLSGASLVKRSSVFIFKFMLYKNTKFSYKSSPVMLYRCKSVFSYLLFKRYFNNFSGLFSSPWYSQICTRCKFMLLSIAKAILLNSLVYMIRRSLDFTKVVWYKHLASINKLSRNMKTAVSCKVI